MAETTTADLDRCPHGRHVGDACAGWGPGPFDGGCEGGYSLGNPYADGRMGRIGTTIYGEPIATGDIPGWQVGDA